MTRKRLGLLLLLLLMGFFAVVVGSRVGEPGATPPPPEAGPPPVAPEPPEEAVPEDTRKIPPDEVRIRGVVLDHEGAPVDGAWVSPGWRPVVGAYFPGREPGRQVFLTDEQGRFEIPKSAHLDGFRLYVAHPLLPATISELQGLRPGYALEGVEIRLDPPCSAKITLVADGGPVTGKVQHQFLFSAGDPRTPAADLPFSHPYEDPFTTGPVFSLHGFSGRPFRMYVQVPGYVPRVLDEIDALPDSGTGMREVALVLDKGLSVTGALLDPEGKPLPNTTVHAHGGRDGFRARTPFW